MALIGNGSAEAGGVLDADGAEHGADLFVGGGGGVVVDPLVAERAVDLKASEFTGVAGGGINVAALREAGAAVKAHVDGGVITDAVGGIECAVLTHGTDGG